MFEIIESRMSFFKKSWKFLHRCPLGKYLSELLPRNFALRVLFVGFDNFTTRASYKTKSIFVSSQRNSLLSTIFATFFLLRSIRNFGLSLIFFLYQLNFVIVKTNNLSNVKKRGKFAFLPVLSVFFTKGERTTFPFSCKLFPCLN